MGKDLVTEGPLDGSSDASNSDSATFVILHNLSTDAIFGRLLVPKFRSSFSSSISMESSISSDLFFSVVFEFYDEESSVSSIA